MIKKTGFTLIEVLIAVLVVGILAAIAVPAYTSYVEDAKQAGSQADRMPFIIKCEEEKMDIPGLSCPSLDEVKSEEDFSKAVAQYEAYKQQYSASKDTTQLSSLDTSTWSSAVNLDTQLSQVNTEGINNSNDPSSSVTQTSGTTEQTETGSDEQNLNLQPTIAPEGTAERAEQGPADSESTAQVAVSSNQTTTLTPEPENLSFKKLEDDGKIETGAGEDKISIEDMKDESVLNSGAGNDFVEITDKLEDDARIDTGAGDDSVTISKMKDDALLETGEGNDQVLITNKIEDDARISTGDGDDIITVKEFDDFDGIIDGGSGDDLLVLFDYPKGQWDKGDLEGLSSRLIEIEKVEFENGQQYAISDLLKSQSDDSRKDKKR